MEKQQTKTLVIHPDDRSTDFLAPIYANIFQATVVTSGVTKDEVNQLIAEHDQVMMMGHGSPSGLFSCAEFGSSDYSGFIIDNKTVELLRQKDNSIFIWCNADRFVNQYQVKGFYTGMFISEVMEANYCGLPGTPQDIVTTSNNYFAELLGEVINEPLSVIYEHVKENYGLLTENNPVALYNYNRLYLN
jgi:hypothetical protein